MVGYDPLDEEPVEEARSEYDLALSGVLARKDGRRVIAEIIARCGVLTPGGDRALHTFGCGLVSDVRRVAPEVLASVLLDERK